MKKTNKMGKIYKLNENDLTKIVKKLIKEHKQTYFGTFSGAVQYARKYVEDRGYMVDEDDWFNEVNVGVGKPKEGRTTKISLGLYKNGKKLSKMLHIQVYNMGISIENNYELNFYVN